MTHDEFLTRVADRAGLRTVEQAERATDAVLRSFGERLSPLEAEALADALPTPLGARVRERPHGADFDRSEMIDRVAERTGVRRGIAVELASSVGETIGETIGDDAIHRLEQELPADIAHLLVPADRATHETPVHLHPERRTLSEGRPGSSHPLSEATADRAQSESVARTSDPHADTRLSSAHGLTQEREDETIAAGREGSTRPLSEGK